jgi:hypothetical protein
MIMYYPWVRKPVATATTAAPPPQARRRAYDWRLLIVRAADPSAALPDIKRQIWAVDSHQAIDRVALVSDTYAAAFGRQRFVLRLMTVFSLIALGLTAAGIFGVLSQVVTRRTREIGIRMALGARPADVLGQILRGGWHWPHLAPPWDAPPHSDSRACCARCCSASARRIPSASPRSRSSSWWLRSSPAGGRRGQP